MERWRKVRAAYRNEQRRLNALFKQDALAAVGLADYSKHDAVFTYAWDQNSGFDLQTVFGALCELAELIELKQPACQVSVVQEADVMQDVVGLKLGSIG